MKDFFDEFKLDILQSQLKYVLAAAHIVSERTWNEYCEVRDNEDEIYEKLSENSEDKNLEEEFNKAVDRTVIAYNANNAAEEKVDYIQHFVCIIDELYDLVAEVNSYDPSIIKFIESHLKEMNK